MSTPKWVHKKRQNKNKNTSTDFCVLIGNYPRYISPDAIVQSIITQVYSINKIEIDFTRGTLFNEFEFSIFLPNKEQMDAIIDLNGAYIYNNPIWIIKYPFQYQNYRAFFSGIISSAISDGQADFNNFAQRCDILGKNSKTMNFNNRDFTEFFFYLLGSESRDKRMYIETLVLTNNNITDLNRYSSFLFFLPTLRKLIANQNPLKFEPSLTQWPRVWILFDPVKNKKNYQNSAVRDLWENDNNQSKKKNQNPWDQDQDQNPWDKDQNKNPWDQGQNQNNKHQQKNQNSSTQILGNTINNTLYFMNLQCQSGWNQNQSPWVQNQNQGKNQKSIWDESQDEDDNDQNQTQNQDIWNQNQNQYQNQYQGQYQNQYQGQYQNQYQGQYQTTTPANPWSQGGGGDDDEGFQATEELPDVSGRIQMTESDMPLELFRMRCAQNTIHD